MKRNTQMEKKDKKEEPLKRDERQVEKEIDKRERLGLH